MSIVKEFYANVSETLNDRAMVNRVLVPFGASVINTYYDKKDVTQGEYETHLKNVHFEIVIKALIEEGAK